MVTLYISRHSYDSESHDSTECVSSLAQALHLGQLSLLAAVAGALQLVDHPLQERDVLPHLGELPIVRGGRRHLRRGTL